MDPQIIERSIMRCIDISTRLGALEDIYGSGPWCGPMSPVSSTNADAASRAARIPAMAYCATCSAAPSRRVIDSKPSGTRAPGSSSTGDRRACGCSARTFGRSSARSCAATKPREKLLNGLDDSTSGEWVSPGENGDGPVTKYALYCFWTKSRDTAEIVADARLHDPRRSYTHAVMSGTSLHVAGRPLGHCRARTTNRYVHLDDATLSEAAERVAVTTKPNPN